MWSKHFDTKCFFLTKIVKEIENRYSVQQDGRLLQYDILTWGKSNTAKKIFLTKPVKEIKWKSILFPGLQIWSFFIYWYIVVLAH